MISGARKYVVLRSTWFRIAMLSFAHIGFSMKALRAFFLLDAQRKKYTGDEPSTKSFKANGRYFLFNHMPGFPSKAFDRFIREELNLIEQFDPNKRSLRSVVLSITKRCPLSCEHCYELDLLNKKEKLTLSDLKKIVADLQDQGVTQIYLSGGEPMARFNDLVELLKSAKEGTDFWLVTSGIHLSLERAKLLKQTGRLTGVCVSIDHYSAKDHDLFRGKANSFEEAIAAVRNCRRIDLAAGMAICTTRSFIQWDNLMQYAELARSLGAQFIQLQEPYAVGGYMGKNVALSQQHLQLLDLFYKKLNTDRKYSDMPIVVYHGHHQRKVGCFGAGDRYMYIDSDGDIHSCPYCRMKVGNILQLPFEQCIDETKKSGCHSFRGPDVPYKELQETLSINNF